MNVRATWGVAQKNAKRELVCGDAYVMAQRDHEMFWAVIDGAGHGRKANEVALKAVEIIRSMAFTQSLDKILVATHRALRGKRGAAVSLVKLRTTGGVLDYAGVGNVEMRSHGPTRIHPVSSPGILGRALRRVKIFTYEVQPGDLLALFSDGITSRFSINGYAHMQPEEAATKILQDNHKPIDDGTVVVIRMSDAIVPSARKSGSNP